MIPKVIYMCHKNLDKIKIYSQNWKKLNPNYEIKLYDDEMCKKFLLEEYSQLYLDIFNYLEDGPIKADFWRVCILYKYGGLYADADIEPLVSLSKYIDDNDEFVTCISMNFNENFLEFQFNPHFIICNKDNKILEDSINRYIKKYNEKHIYEYWDWSICKQFIINGVKDKKSQIINIDNIKYKFLYEVDSNSCEYNGEVVLRNRYNNYINHHFI